MDKTPLGDVDCLGWVVCRDPSLEANCRRFEIAGHNECGRIVFMSLCPIQLGHVA